MDRRNFLKFGCFSAFAGLTGSYPLLIERQFVQFNKYQLVLPNLPEAFDGFTIGHLTDIHYGMSITLNQLGKIVSKVNSLQCDLIVCTGDYVHEKLNTTNIDKVMPILGSLQAKNGVFSVLGNHDHWANTDRSLYWLTRNQQNLCKKVSYITRSNQKLWLVGAGDLWEDHIDIDMLMGNIPENECRIVLAHNPDSADTVEKARVDLVISGHTHGGQVRIPFVGPPVLYVKNKEYTSGIKKSNKGSPVFISRGVGCALLPIRFNCYPEVALITLKKGLQVHS